MAKPASLPRWANSGGSIVEPSSGKKDIGWVVTEKPPAQYFNWYMNLVYQWCTWLDGLQAENLTWTGIHTFTHASTALSVTNTLHAGVIDCGEIACTGDMLIDDIACDDITADDITCDETIATTGLTTAAASMKHGVRTVCLSSAEGVADPAEAVPAHVVGLTAWKAAAASGQVYIPIPLLAGDRLVSVTVTGLSTGVAWTAQLYKTVLTAGGLGATQISVTKTSGTGTATEDLTMNAGSGGGTPLPVTAGATESYHVIFQFGASDYTNQRFYGLKYTYDRVAQ